MLRKVLLSLTLGLVWLFLFSIPFDDERRVFDVGYTYLVDTKPVHWIVNHVRVYFDMTRATISNEVERVKPAWGGKMSSAKGSRETQN